MDRTTTTDAFMRGFYKAAFDAGLTPDQAAEMHAVAIINEARFRSPEFASGFDKVAGVEYPWYDPRRWVGMQPATAAPAPLSEYPPHLIDRRTPPLHPQPVKHPVSETLKPHAGEYLKDLRAASGTPEKWTDQAVIDGTIKKDFPKRIIPEHNAKVTSPPSSPITPKPLSSSRRSLPSDNPVLSDLLKPGPNGVSAHHVRVPTGVAGARG